MPYIIRDTKSDLWQAFRARAASEGRSLRWVLETLIARYVAEGLPGAEARGEGSGVSQVRNDR
jgi:hypothetical protein